MDNITNTILPLVSEMSLNESLKQASTFVFDNGDTENIGHKSNPNIIVDLSYKNLTYTQFLTLEVMYQTYFSNTFIVELQDYEDIRKIVADINGAVWGFGGFEFETTGASGGLYNGKITLITSTFYNFENYQDIYTELITDYTVTTTTNTEFIELLTEYNPIKVNIKYILNNLVSNIGKSVQLQQNKIGSAKSFDMEFLIDEEGYFKILAFYRKKGAITTFGVPTMGYLPQIFDIEEDPIMLCKFKDDTIKRIRLNNGLNHISLTVVQVS